MAELGLPLCLDSPNPKKFEIPLPFGSSLKPLMDLSKGAPTDCELVHSLILQIMPMLAGMECVLRILKVVKALEGVAKNGFAPNKVGDLLDAIGEMAECFLMLTPAGIGKLVAAILRIVIHYLECFIEAFMSIYNFQVGIDLTSAAGNPVLLNSMKCAQQNGKKSMDALMGSMEGVQPLLEIIELLGGIGGLEIKMPSLSDITKEADPLKAIEKLRDTLEALAQLADSLPV
jgi:hypothetical protein